jgi:hypothetical protein
MDGFITRAGEDTPRALLKEARRLSGKIRGQLSIDLPAVTDHFSLSSVQAWRRNGMNHNHPIHQMMPRVGGFPPSLARYFIAAYSEPGEIVFDPYCGKGTVLFEATRMGRHAFGGDTAPDAVISSRAKCVPVSFSQVANYIQRLPITRTAALAGVPSDVKLFYHPDTLRQVLRVRDQLLIDLVSSDKRTRDTANFVCGVMLGLLHGHSALALSLPCNQCFAMSPGYVRRYVREHDLKRPRRDVRQCLMEKAIKLFPQPRMVGKAKIFQASAEECLRYLRTAKGNVALVITSPPYLDRQTYSKDAWLRLWFLRCNHREVAKQSLQTGSVRLFVDAMQKSLDAIMKCIKVGGRLVLIGGKARVAVGGDVQFVRIIDLCVLALSRINRKPARLSVETVIHDWKVMNRGSYFAVHRGKSVLKGGGVAPRNGEEDILIVRKLS